MAESGTQREGIRKENGCQHVEVQRIGGRNGGRVCSTHDLAPPAWMPASMFGMFWRSMPPCCVSTSSQSYPEKDICTMRNEAVSVDRSQPRSL